MALSIPELVKDMLNASKPVLKNYWKEVKPFAEKESRSFAQNLVMIEKLKLTGDLTEKEAKLHVKLQTNSFRTVLLAIEGLGIIAVENAINAAIGAIRKTVNTSLGWAIL